jgi:hypothetical protein
VRTEQLVSVDSAGDAQGEGLVRRHGLQWIIVAVVISGLLIYFFGRHHGTPPSTVAAASGAISCDDSGYSVVSKITGARNEIYDCSFVSGEKCVTYESGVADDSTAEVRILFASTLGSKKPSCLG